MSRIGMIIIIIFLKKYFQKVPRVESEIRTTQNQQDSQQFTMMDKQDNLRVDPDKRGNMRSQEYDMGWN